MNLRGYLQDSVDTMPGKPESAKRLWRTALPSRFGWRSANRFETPSIDYLLLDSLANNARALAGTLYRWPRFGLRVESISVGFPATMLNNRPKSRVNSSQVRESIPKRSNNGATHLGVEPRLPGFNCLAVQSSNSRYSAVLIRRNPLSLARRPSVCTHAPIPLWPSARPTGQSALAIYFSVGPRRPPRVDLPLRPRREAALACNSRTRC